MTKKKFWKRDTFLIGAAAFASCFTGIMLGLDQLVIDALGLTIGVAIGFGAAKGIQHLRGEPPAK